MKNVSSSQIIEPVLSTTHVAKLKRFCKRSDWKNGYFPAEHKTCVYYHAVFTMNSQYFTRVKYLHIFTSFIEKSMLFRVFKFGTKHCSNRILKVCGHFHNSLKCIYFLDFNVSTVFCST